jgi:hypothetical protein
MRAPPKHVNPMSAQEQGMRVDRVVVARGVLRPEVTQTQDIDVPTGPRLIRRPSAGPVHEAQLRKKEPEDDEPMAAYPYREHDDLGELDANEYVQS